MPSSGVLNNVIKHPYPTGFLNVDSVPPLLIPCNFPCPEICQNSDVVVNTQNSPAETKPWPPESNEHFQPDSLKKNTRLYQAI